VTGVPGAGRDTSDEVTGAAARARRCRVLLVGAGGHARVCTEALRETGWCVVGAVDRDGSGGDVLGAPVIGRDTEIGEVVARAGAGAVCVAVGDNGARRALTERVEAVGLRLATVLARSAVVSPSAVLAPGAQLLPGVVVNARARIGRGAIVNTNATVDHDCVVGDFSHVAPGSAIGGDVEIGPGTFLGIGSRVMPGRRIGAGATVGAGAVVVHDVAPGATVVGVPARELQRSGEREP
jgi:UDP-perosamine 4-acetyltransferase